MREVELDEPNGWTVIPLTSTAPTDGAIATHNFVRAFMIQVPLPSAQIFTRAPRSCCSQLCYAAVIPWLQVAILANHQNGRDSHVRQIKIYVPRQS